MAVSWSVEPAKDALTSHALVKRGSTRVDEFEMEDSVRARAIARLFAAVDAGDECQQLTKMTIHRPEPVRLTDFLLGVISASARASKQKAPTAYEFSRAMTSSREFARSLQELSADVPDQRLLDLCHASKTWSDRLQNKEEIAVYEEVTKAVKLVNEYRQKADGKGPWF